MLNGLLSSSAIPVLEQVVNFAQARHDVLAGNIANIDTPGYEARDLSVDSFRADLRSAIVARDKPAVFRGGAPSLDQPGHVGPKLATVADNAQTILRHDENFVGLEHQVTEIAKNRLLHNTALTIMTNQFRLLEAAIRERL